MKKMRKLAKHNLGLSTTTLNEDMMTEIFLWLPLKSLIRFKRLSKRWYFLISDKHKSYFRRNYLSTLSTRRERNRIVGSDDDDDDSAIMAGLFYQKKPDSENWTFYDRIQFLPAFLSLDGSLDNFLSCCLNLDPDPAVHGEKLLVAGSSNGFLLLSLECEVYDHYYLFNPVTMECLALPKRLGIENIQRLGIETNVVYVGFVCKGDYPSLDLVEYTIVRLTWLEERVSFLFELFSTGDNEWSEYRVSGESLQVKEFDLYGGQHNSVIVTTTTTTTTNNQGGGGRRIVVYFLVVLPATWDIAIVVFDLNKGGGDKSLQMIKTPGPYRGRSVLECDDYIREFDDGVIHYVRIFCSTDFEFWVFNTRSGEWYLKHRASLTPMTHYPWMDIHKWYIAIADEQEVCARFHIHAFHPMNPNLIFLTLYGRVVCYNVETGMLELVYDFTTPQQNIKLDDYCHYVYQWPCWPPLL